MYKVLDLLGRRFGKLVVVGTATRGKSNKVRWLCVCDCGEEAVVLSNYLRRGDTKSCGCIAPQRCKTKGASSLPEYKSWQGMKSRCYRIKNTKYKSYGGRGISVCPEWVDSFDRFYEDMGKKPTPLHTIDRIDNDGDYTPDNCRWATRREQSRNTQRSRFLDYNGVKKNMEDWADEAGLTSGTLSKRLKLGWSMEKALTKPVLKR